jgi:hypothetical protein
MTVAQCGVCDELLIAYAAGMSVHDAARALKMDAQHVLDHAHAHGLSVWRNQGPTRCTCGAWVTRAARRCGTCDAPRGG